MEVFLQDKNKLYYEGLNILIHSTRACIYWCICLADSFSSYKITSIKQITDTLIYTLYLFIHKNKKKGGCYGLVLMIPFIMRGWTATSIRFPAALPSQPKLDSDKHERRCNRTRYGDIYKHKFNVLKCLDQV